MRRRGWRDPALVRARRSGANLKTRGYFKITTGELTAEQAEEARGSRSSLCAVGQRYFRLIRRIGPSVELIGIFATRVEAEHRARLICQAEAVRLVFALD